MIHNEIRNTFEYLFTFKSVLMIPKSLESDWTILSIKFCIPNIGFIDISGHKNGFMKQNHFDLRHPLLLIKPLTWDQCMIVSN